MVNPFATAENNTKPAVNHVSSSYPPLFIRISSRIQEAARYFLLRAAQRMLRSIWPAASSIRPSHTWPRLRSTYISIPLVNLLNYALLRSARLLVAYSPGICDVASAPDGFTAELDRSALSMVLHATIPESSFWASTSLGHDR